MDVKILQKGKFPRKRPFLRELKNRQLKIQLLSKYKYNPTVINEKLLLY